MSVTGGPIASLPNPQFPNNPEITNPKTLHYIYNATGVSGVTLKKKYYQYSKCNNT